MHQHQAPAANPLKTHYQINDTTQQITMARTGRHRARPRQLTPCSSRARPGNCRWHPPRADRPQLCAELPCCRSRCHPCGTRHHAHRRPGSVTSHPRSNRGQASYPRGWVESLSAITITSFAIPFFRVDGISIFRGKQVIPRKASANEIKSPSSTANK